MVARAHRWGWGRGIRPVRAGGGMAGWFFLSLGLSTIAGWMTRIAVAWTVFNLSGSPLWLGVAGLAGQLPVCMLAAVGGRTIDRLGALRVLRTSYGLAAAQATLLGLLAANGGLGLGQLIPLALARGVIAAFELPAKQAFLCAGAARQGAFPRGLATDSLITNLGRLLGPALAALILPRAGMSVCFFIDAASYLGPIFFLGAVAFPAAHSDRPRNGAPRSRACPEVRSALRRLGCLSLFGLPFSVLLPVHVRLSLGAGAGMLGWFVSLSSLGAIWATLMAIRHVPAGRSPMAGVGAALGLGVLALSRQPWLSGIGVMAASYFLMWQIIGVMATIHRLTPEAARGRTAAAVGLAFWGMAPFGGLLAGGLAEWLSPPAALAIDGGVCLLTAFFRFSPDTSPPWRNPPDRSRIDASQA